jgi:hypothetical protein
MIRLKKKYFTLLELLIAMSMAAALIVSVLYFYRYATHLDAEITKTERRSFQSGLLQGRLTYIFSRANVSGEKNKKPLFFTLPEYMGLTQGPSILFTYESDAAGGTFSDTVLARLFLNPKNQLCLAIWPYNRAVPAQGMPPMHFEVIAENIEKIDFDFLVGESEATPAGSFVQSWPSSVASIPAAFRLYATRKGEDVQTFAFPIPPLCRENP